MNLDVAPTAVPLATWSPSALNQFLSCPKQLAYARDERTAVWRRPGTRTALGLVAHALTETVDRGQARGDPDDVLGWIEGKWAELVSQQVRRLAEAWPGRAVPPPEAWPGYATTKVRLIRNLARRAVVSSATPGTVSPPRPEGGPGHPRLPWIERRLSDPQHRLVGIPDRVEEVAGRLRVVDLKAGVRQGEPSPNQVRQLHLYAWLVKSALGRWPDDLVVLDVRGNETKVPLDRAAVATLVATAIDALEQFNADAAHSERVEARPTSETCQWCEFRVVCGDYWSHRTAAWLSHEDVAGVVTEVAHGRVRVRTLDGTSQLWLLVPGPDLPTAGDGLVAVDLEPSGFETFRCRWNSRVRVLPAVVKPEPACGP